MTNIYAGMSMAFILPLGEGSLNRAFALAKGAVILIAAVTVVATITCLV